MGCFRYIIVYTLHKGDNKDDDDDDDDNNNNNNNGSQVQSHIKKMMQQYNRAVYEIIVTQFLHKMYKNKHDIYTTNKEWAVVEESDKQRNVGCGGYKH